MKETGVGKLMGYKVIEDNSLKEIRLPGEVIEFIKEPYVAGCEWSEE